MSGAAPELAAVRMRLEHMASDLTRLEGGRVNMSPARPLAPALARSALAVTITWLCLAAASPRVGAPPEEASGVGAHYDVVISGGTVYDGSGSPPFVGDVALRGDRIVYVGPLAPGSASERVEARGKAVTPGFINMLAHPEESLIADGRALSDLRQGVTLEVLGEDSMGPLTAEMKRHARERQADIHYTVDWTTLGEYLHKLERHGIAPNVASFVGAGTVRTNADMYVYTAGATGLDAAMPPWVQDGGLEAWIRRLQDPAVRARVLAEMRDPAPPWENLYGAAGAAGTLLLGFKNPQLKPLTGKTLAEVAKMRGVSAEDAAIDLVIQDGSRVAVGYFLMSEENVRRELALPWVSFDSDADAPAPEGVFLKS